MSFVKHPLIKPNTIEARRYQEIILNTALKRNCLVVVSTGLGKTLISVLVTADRLYKYPDAKAMILSPTRPLCAQIQKVFQNTLEIEPEKIVLITGKIRPEDRELLYKQGKIIISTPQCISNDLNNNLINLKDFSVITFDEAQHAIGNYSYTHVAKKYIEQCKNPLILGLTASPGGSKEKISEICKNLFIDAVEIKTETDEDVKPYVKEIKTEFVKVELPENFKNAQAYLKNALKIRLEKLKEFNVHTRTKKELLELQKKASKQLQTEKKPFLFYLISLIVEAVKIWHVLELFETQSIKAVKNYLNKVKQKKTKSDKGLLNDPIFLNAMKIIESSEEHPKIEKLKEVIKKEIELNKNVSIIVFSHYRENIFNLYEILKEVCRPIYLVGQAGEKGLTQKEQIDVIKDFNAGYYNCLIGSPISEEGLHIPSADIAIFYDSVPSEIRMIQRRGRVGRTKVGKIILLLTKGTRDEGYYWVSYRKEKKMKEILKDLKNKNQNLNNFA
ncbi:MAG: DEAD/DEAH box helicase [Candidatus Aenigmatarchaeota archaeon]